MDYGSRERGGSVHRTGLAIAAGLLALPLLVSCNDATAEPISTPTAATTGAPQIPNENNTPSMMPTTEITTAPPTATSSVSGLPNCYQLMEEQGVDGFNWIRGFLNEGDEDVNGDGMIDPRGVDGNTLCVT